MDDDLVLRNHACFALYSASRAVIGVYRPLLDRLGLTYPQFLVLAVLWESDGRSVSDIGQALHLESGTVSPMVKRLERAGLVERRRESTDERRVTVHLTTAGDRLRESAADLPGQVSRAAGLTDESVAALRDALNSVTDAVDEYLRNS